KFVMYNWNVDVKTFKKTGKPYIIWRIEQMVNFGLNDERLDKKLVKKFWKELHLDPDKKNFLKMLLWKRKS
ncbi:MAG: hypothetical protein COW10_06900, partial [Candidatus Omnitrophica bacterium CG12_big_fil_rev_8_21_14_0_65_42_8]